MFLFVEFPIFIGVTFKVLFFMTEGLRIVSFALFVILSSVIAIVIVILSVFLVVLFWNHSLLIIFISMQDTVIIFVIILTQ